MHTVFARGPHRRADPLGRSEGYAKLAIAIIENDYLNGEVIRLRSAETARRIRPRHVTARCARERFRWFYTDPIGQ